MWAYAQPPGCDPLHLPHGRVTGYTNIRNGTYPANTIATYVCNEGFLPIDPATVNCSEDSTWISSQETLCRTGKGQEYNFVH